MRSSYVSPTLGSLQTMDERRKLSETMQACVKFMLMHEDSIHRHPGGFWWERDSASNYRSGFGTATVHALVARGVAEYTEWQEGRSGRFPIKATLKLADSAGVNDGD